MKKQKLNSARAALFLRNHWLMLLIVIQPLLDMLAFWTQKPDGSATVAGAIRLLVMVLLPIWLLFTIKEKKDRRNFALLLCAVGILCALHVLNLCRVGIVSLRYEVSYMAKIAQMPVLAFCFVYAIRDAQTRNQVYWGLFFAASITALGLALSVVTGTANVTYGEGLGVSGWVIDDNRTANSTILVVLSAFSVFCAVKSDKKAVNILVPVLAALVLFTNGTMTCYLSIFLIFLGFALFLPLEKLVRGASYSRLAVGVLVAAAVVAAVCYPLTPKARVRQSQTDFMEKTQSEFEAELPTAPDRVSPEEILNDPDMHTRYEDFYWKCLWILSPDMFERFDIDEIMAKYGFTADTTILLNTRALKRAYVSLMWDHSDTLTRIFGIDISSAWLKGGVDLENDWPAIFYYCGYVGFAAYVCLIAYFAFLIARRLLQDLRSAFTADNFIVLLCFALLIGIAQYSGAVLRRPNVSIYLSLILGLIHYQTCVCPVGRVCSWRGEWL